MGLTRAGVPGPETQRALLRFQQGNGLERTAKLDQPTADALIGNRFASDSALEEDGFEPLVPG